MVRAKTWPAVQLGQDGGESHKESTGLVCTSSVSLGAGPPTALDPGVSDSDHRVPAELGQESQASSCLRKCAQAWKPSSQHAGEKRGVAGLLLGISESRLHPDLPNQNL